jgi:tetratricopeptide (TPR) repeat protein
MILLTSDNSSLKLTSMKKGHLYLVILLLFITAAGFIVVKYKGNEKKKAAAFYPLYDRKGPLAGTGEAKEAKRQFDELMKVAGTNPADTKSRISLAALYLQEARVTGEYMYYDMAAMKYVNEVLEKEPANFEALTFKALIYLSQHHFAEGLAIAGKARDANPYNAFVQGIIVDGNVEMGNYKAAVDAADKMVSIRPDIRSYSRISYLREIHGDYPGAIEAMKLAVDAGRPGDEGTEWSRVQLGHLYENTGDWKSAGMNYLIALQHRPAYAYAIAGQARIAAALKDYAKATAFYLQADSLVNDYSFKEQLAEIYQMTGQHKKADELNNWLINAMSRDAKSGQEDDDIGHYADRELAYTYLRSGEYDKALEHATAEYNRRPANIDVNEMMAWVYYKKGNYDKALAFVERAVKTNSHNPLLLCRAGLIYAKAGDKLKAKTLLEKIRGNIPGELKTDAANILKTL